MDLLTFYSMAENTLKSIPSVVDENGYSYVWAVVITGLSVVFLGLVILILFVWLMGKAFTAIQNKNKPAQLAAEPKSPMPAKVSPPVQSVSVNNDNDEIIAVISAAVAAMGQIEGKTYKLKSVKAVTNNKSRSAWAMAGLQSDTTPF